VATYGGLTASRTWTGSGWDDNSKYVSIFLKLEDKSKNVKAVFEASMMGKDGKPRRQRSSSIVFPTYHENGERGWRLMEKSQLVPAFVKADGCFTIVCRITVLPGGDALDVPQLDMGAHFGPLLDSGDGSDVSFLVGGETFRAHRAVLATRSLARLQGAAPRLHGGRRDAFHHPARRRSGDVCNHAPVHLH